jgi:2-polyprenyl-3-methyl-5-hydroxy-6-metoxy-1,4-benzoquinol methylase
MGSSMMFLILRWSFKRVRILLSRVGMCFSTINRNAKGLLFAMVGAEYIHR